MNTVTYSKFKIGDIVQDAFETFEILNVDNLTGNYLLKIKSSGVTTVANMKTVERVSQLITKGVSIGDTITKIGFGIEAVITDIVGEDCYFKYTVYPGFDNFVGFTIRHGINNLFKEDWVLKTSAPQAKQNSSVCGCDNFTLFNKGCQCGAFKSELSKKGA